MAAWFTREAVEGAVFDLPEIKITSASIWAGNARRSQWNARFSSSRRRAGPRDNHQEGRKGARAHFGSGDLFFALVSTHTRFP